MNDLIFNPLILTYFLLYNSSMTEVSRFINLLIEFGQKLESHVNKKYRSFIRSTLNLQELAKNVSPQKVILTHQVIAFKLGVESKSTKCIEMTLNYLLKLFSLGYINIHVPNYCEEFTIMEASVVREAPVPNKVYEKQLREQICSWLSPLVHFKNNQINALLLKVYQYLISEPILPSLLELSTQITSEQCYATINSFFSYRFYLFEEVYEYRQEQIHCFAQLGSHNNQKHNAQIKNAMERQEILENLIEKYVDEIVSRVAGEGGKYGCCVVCGQAAEHYCKNTKAALCGLDCKKKHLQIAQKQYKSHYQAVVLGQSIIESMNFFCNYLAERDSPFLLNILLTILENPYIFMLVCPTFKSLLKKHLPKIMDKVYQSKHEQTFETLYFMMPSLIKWWAPESLTQVEYFFKQNILKVLSDKKPNFRALMLTFKSLDRIFQNGKTVVQLYINLDCEMNRVNVIGQTLFQLSKMAQDRFVHSNQFLKQQKISIKNSCMTLFISLCKGLNRYRKIYNQVTLPSSKEHFIEQKQRKNNMQKFVQKFNEHWSEGLKSLFNLDLVGLDSNHQIINIIMSQGGLKKSNIDAMLFDKTCQQYLQIFISRLTEDIEPTLMPKLLQLFQYIPMTETASIGVKKFIEVFEPLYPSDEEKIPIKEQVNQIQLFLTKCKNYKQFLTEIKKYHPDEKQYDYLYLRMIKARKADTTGLKTHNFIICLSHSYLETMSSQLSLLQIPISYLLETDYDPDRILTLTRQLIPLSLHSNWISLQIKYTDIDSCNQNLLNPSNLKIIRGIMEIVNATADYISQDWLPILTFFCNVHYLLTQPFPATKKNLLQNQTILKGQLSLSLIENSLINSSIQCKQRFDKFVGTVLLCALQSLKSAPSHLSPTQQQQVFMLQKFFHIIEVNLPKFINNFDKIFKSFEQFLQNIQSILMASPEIYIYICDNLKQILLKVLKKFTAQKEKGVGIHKKEKDLECKISCKIMEVFKKFLNENHGKQVKQFVMNCITTFVVHHYHLQPQTWAIVMQIMEKQTQDFPYQAGVIIRKILSEKMAGLVHCSQNLIQICVRVVRSKNNEDSKACVECIHNVKTIIQLMVSNYHLKNEKQKQQEIKVKEEEGELIKEIYEEQFLEKLKKLLHLSIQTLMCLLEIVEYGQTVAETLFLLFSFGLKPLENLFDHVQHQQSQNQQKQKQYSLSKANKYPSLLNIPQDISQFIDKMFDLLQKHSIKSKIHEEMAERIMNETLYWSVRQHNKSIINNLQMAIINKFSRLSITALKCIKTYIQMADPRAQTEWQDIQSTLMRVIKNTLIFGEEKPKTKDRQLITVEGILNNKYDETQKNESGGNQVCKNIFEMAHKSQLQNLAIKLLPNDKKCLPLLLEAYSQKIEFNDDLIHRIHLWKNGLCSSRENPPDLLSLQEVVSNRIMAIYIRYNDYTSIIAFFIEICHRYLEASQNLETFKEQERSIFANSTHSHIQLYNLYTQYLARRRNPLLKLIGYVLPKLPRYCSDPKTKKTLLLELSRMLPAIQSRDPFLKTIRQLSQAKYE